MVEILIFESVMTLTNTLSGEIIGTLLFGGSTLLFLYFITPSVIVEVLTPSVKEGEVESLKVGEAKDLKESSSLSNEDKECSLEETKESPIVNETVQNLDSYGSEVVLESLTLVERTPLDAYINSLIALYDIIHQAIITLEFSEEDPLYLKNSTNFEEYLDCLFPVFLLLWTGDFMFLSSPDFLPSNPEVGILEGIKWLNSNFVEIWELTECLLRGIYVHLKNSPRFSNNLRLIEKFFERVELSGTQIEGFRTDNGKKYFKRYSSLFEKMNLTEQSKIFSENN